MLIDTSLSAGTLSSTSSLRTVPCAGTSMELFPPNVTGRSVVAVTDEPDDFSPIEAPPMVRGAALMALVNFTRARSPPTVTQTVCRTVVPVASGGTVAFAAWTGAAQVVTQLLLRCSSRSESSRPSDQAAAATSATAMPLAMLVRCKKDFIGVLRRNDRQSSSSSSCSRLLRPFDQRASFG